MKVKKGNPFGFPYVTILFLTNIAQVSVLRCKCINSCVVISDSCRSSQYPSCAVKAKHPHLFKHLIINQLVEMSGVEPLSIRTPYTGQQTYNISIYPNVFNSSNVLSYINSIN